MGKTMRRMPSVDNELVMCWTDGRFVTIYNTGTWITKPRHTNAFYIQSPRLQTAVSIFVSKLIFTFFVHPCYAVPQEGFR